MRTAILAAAAFAVGVISVPHQHHAKRDVVTETDVDIVYETQVVTVTAGAGNLIASPSANILHHHHNRPAEPSAYTVHASPNAPEVTSSRRTHHRTSTTSSQHSTRKLTHKSSPTPATSTKTASPAPTRVHGSGNCPSSPPSTSYEDLVVFHHNIHRCNHSASDIAWDAGLAKSAATIAASCVYAHNTAVDGGGYGQNIAAGVAPANISAVITDLFYNGEVENFNGLYGEANPSMANFEVWGHFSQIVWEATTHVACVTQDCSKQGLKNVGSNVRPYFTVCNYASPGNVGGEYGKNIGEPLGHPTAQWNTGE